MSSPSDGFWAFEGARHKMKGEDTPLPAAESRKRSCRLAGLDDDGQAGNGVELNMYTGSAGDKTSAANEANKETLISMSVAMASWKIPGKHDYLKVMEEVESLQLTVGLALSDKLAGFTQADMKAVVEEFSALKALVAGINEALNPDDMVPEEFNVLKALVAGTNEALNTDDIVPDTLPLDDTIDLMWSVEPAGGLGAGSIVNDTQIETGNETDEDNPQDSQAPDR
jgi:hypothetical protein